MANYKRKRPRTSGAHSVARFPSGMPRWHNLIFHTRPRRRVEKALLGKLLQDADPDALAWPLSHKPEVYYW